jgi:hypothetical protein
MIRKQRTSSITSGQVPDIVTSCRSISVSEAKEEIDSYRGEHDHSRYFIFPSSLARGAHFHQHSSLYISRNQTTGAIKIPNRVPTGPVGPIASRINSGK